MKKMIKNPMFWVLSVSAIAVALIVTNHNKNKKKEKAADTQKDAAAQ